MGTINTGFTERVRYTLEYPQHGSMIIEDPDGWDADEKEIARHEEYHGVFPKFSNNLKFYGDGAAFISLVKEIYGVNALIRLVKEERHPDNDQWERAYEGYLDLFTYEIQDHMVAVKFTSGGLEEDLKARDSDTFELERETTVNGSALGPLKTDTVQLDGRRIFLKTQFEINKTDNGAFVSVSSADDGQLRHTVVPVPLHLISKSHEEASDPIPNTNADANTSDPSIMFFLNSENPRRLHVYGTIKWDAAVSNLLGTLYSEFGLYLARYGQGGDYNIRERRMLYFRAGNNGEIVEMAVNDPTVIIDEWIDLDPGDHLSLEAILQVRFSNNGVNVVSVANAFYTDPEYGIFVEEDSHFPPSKAKFVLAHEMFDRLTNIITNKPGNFYSSFFGRTDLGYPKNGPGAFAGLTHGFWVRGFDKLPAGTESNPNPYKSMSTSIKDQIQSFTATHNIGLGIERIGFKERIVVEDQKYFYNRKVTVKLPNPVKNVKRSVATKYHYSALNIGYEKGGSYEEAMGLDEYNGKSTFTTPMRLPQNYVAVSKNRADSYGKEFARRKPKFRYPTTDSSYDEDTFVMDLAPAGTEYRERKWQDDFAEAPTGTYDPPSATNLRFSPMNLVLRHGWKIAAGMTKNILDKIVYGSSTANSKLTTKLRSDTNYLQDPVATPGNGYGYSENGEIIVSELPQPRYLAEYVEFDHVVDFRLMQQVEGFTVVDGRRLYNVYGLFEFINEMGDIEKGYLISLKPNGEGKWKLLTFNR